MRIGRRLEPLTLPQYLVRLCSSHIGCGLKHCLAVESLQALDLSHTDHEPLQTWPEARSSGCARHTRSSFRSQPGAAHVQDDLEDRLPLDRADQRFMSPFIISILGIFLQEVAPEQEFSNSLQIRYSRMGEAASCIEHMPAPPQVHNTPTSALCLRTCGIPTFSKAASTSTSTILDRSLTSAHASEGRLKSTSRHFKPARMGRSWGGSPK